MKKLRALILASLFVFSIVPVFGGDGDIPIMGRTCGIPNTPPCPAAAPIEPTEDTGIYKTVVDYLAQLFG